MAIQCPPLTIYSFQNVVLTIDGRRVEGFWEGDDAIQLERPTDLGTPLVGADGSSLVSITADQTATLTLRLQPTSPWNRELANRVKQIRNGASVTPMVISLRDTSTGEGGGCSAAVIIKEPDSSWGDAASAREWQIHCSCWQDNDLNYNPA